MDKFGYVKVAAVSPKKVHIGNPKRNYDEIKKLLDRAAFRNAEVIVFPELCITGYTCGDLFNQQALLDEAENALALIADYTTSPNLEDIIVAVGMPIRKDNQLFNCAVLLSGGKILGVVPKTHIPNYNEFYEMRYFAPYSSYIRNTEKEGKITLCNQEVIFSSNLLVECTNVRGKNFVLGTEICEDAWAPITPGAKHCIAGADIIINLSASNELIAKHEYRRNLIKSLSAQEISGYVYASASMDESTSDTVYSGHCIISENGKILAESAFLDDREIIVADIDVERLRSDRTKSTSYMQYQPDETYQSVEILNWRNRRADFNTRMESITPFVPKNIKERSEEILKIQAAGLAQRLKKTGINKVVIGISGGLDSTLALLAAIKAFEIAKCDRKGIIGITMPGFGTTSNTKNNSIELMECLGVTARTIDIKAACEQHLKDIGHPTDVYDIAYENVQARERTQVLMDVANMEGALVIGTGDLSELALGWCTYNGDHMSMYAVNCGIPKTLVRHLVSYYMEKFAEEARCATTEHMLEELEGKESIEARTAKCLKAILDTPVSPELLPPNPDGTIAQKTEDSIGSYVIHDFTMYYALRFGFSPSKILNLFMNSVIETEWENIEKEAVKKNMIIFYRRFFSQQFKRNCVPDGIKVGSISLSPRADLRMPSDATAELWLNEICNE